MRETEVQRIGRELAGVSADALLRRFRAASRADVKLACALRGYFDEDDASYFPYIKNRLRPAAAELIFAGKISGLAKLEPLLTAALTEEFLELAISAGVPSSIIWLLQMKERRFGFVSRELTL